MMALPTQEKSQKPRKTSSEHVEVSNMFGPITKKFRNEKIIKRMNENKLDKLKRANNKERNSVQRGEAKVFRELKRQEKLDAITRKKLSLRNKNNKAKRHNKTFDKTLQDYLGGQPVVFIKPTFKLSDGFYVRQRKMIGKELQEGNEGYLRIPKEIYEHARTVHNGSKVVQNKTDQHTLYRLATQEGWLVRKSPDEIVAFQEIQTFYIVELVVDDEIQKEQTELFQKRIMAAKLKNDLRFTLRRLMESIQTVYIIA
jgi:hypothetical protein